MCVHKHMGLDQPPLANSNYHLLDELKDRDRGDCFEFLLMRGVSRRCWTPPTDVGRLAPALAEGDAQSEASVGTSGAEGEGRGEVDGG